MEKKRYELEIADVEMAIISDEREEFVLRLANELDSNIKYLLKNNKRCSKLDAAILCALDYSSDKVKAEKRVRNLEAQVALYDANIRRLREEVARLRGETFVCPAPRAEKAELEEDVEELRALDGADEAEIEVEVVEAEAEAEVEAADESAVQLNMTEAIETAEEKAEEAAPAEETAEEASKEEKIRRVEELLRRRSEGDAEPTNDKREDKLRQIESLLRR